MRGPTLFLLAGSSLLLSGCIASTLVDVATAPVKVVSKGVDLATTSQSEADEKRGREIRKREERLAKLERELTRQQAECADGDEAACARAAGIRAEMDALLPGIPVEPEER